MVQKTDYFYRGKDWIENFCKKLKEIKTEIINYEEKEMIPLTDKNISLMKSKKNVTYAKRGFVMIKIKKKQIKLYQ